ncbi:MAG: hypothetical protein IKB02_03590 [Clostridia bacterium]|nr:hypothetical protein [Clostridia bacterium]
MPKKQNKQNRHRGSTSVVASSIKSSLISLALSLVLSLLASAVLLSLPDATAIVFPVSAVILYLSSFICGFLSMRGTKEGWLASGAFSGGMLLIYGVFISLFLPDTFSSGRPFLLSVGLRLLIIVFSLFGSYTAKSTLSKKRRIRR